MTATTTDPEVLRDYEEELAYYEEIHPVQVQEPSKLKKFLMKHLDSSMLIVTIVIQEYGMI